MRMAEAWESDNTSGWWGCRPSRLYIIAGENAGGPAMPADSLAVYSEAEQSFATWPSNWAPRHLSSWFWRDAYINLRNKACNTWRSFSYNQQNQDAFQSASG